MFGWFVGWEKYKRNQKCCKEMREFVSCLAFYQDSVTEQNEMCRSFQQDLASCLDGFILKSAQEGSQRTVSGNQNRPPSSDWNKPSSSAFHLG